MIEQVRVLFVCGKIETVADSALTKSELQIYHTLLFQTSHVDFTGYFFVALPHQAHGLELVLLQITSHQYRHSGEQVLYALLVMHRASLSFAFVGPCNVILALRLLCLLGCAFTPFAPYRILSASLNSFYFLCRSATSRSSSRGPLLPFLVPCSLLATCPRATSPIATLPARYPSLSALLAPSALSERQVIHASTPPASYCPFSPPYLLAISCIHLFSNNRASERLARRYSPFSSPQDELDSVCRLCSRMSSARAVVTAKLMIRQSFSDSLTCLFSSLHAKRTTTASLPGPWKLSAAYGLMLIGVNWGHLHE